MHYWGIGNLPWIIETDMLNSRFAQRCDQSEIMDNLEFSGKEMDQALKELETINKWLGGNAVTLAGLSRLRKSMPDNRTISIADLGCGGGDMLKIIADWGRRHHIALELTGIDANEYIVEYARKQTSAYPEIKYLTANVFDPEFQKQQFDIITCTLFTHHFTTAQLLDLLRSWTESARIGVVINDLHRHWLAYYSIVAITRLFSRSFMVKNDGPISVLRAFQRHDIKMLLSRLNVERFQLQWRWAFRWMLVIPT